MPKNFYFLALLCAALSTTQAGPLAELPPHELQANRVQLDQLQQMTAEWIQVKRVAKEEEDRGRLQLSQLQQLKEVVVQQRDHWKTEALALEQKASRADGERMSMLRERSELDDSRTKAISQLRALETRISKLKTRIPEPLKRELATAFIRLEQPFAEEMWLNRYQAALEILKSVQTFHRIYSVVQQDVSLADGQILAGTVLYMGLSNGYFISSDGKQCAWGRPNAQGWSWQRADKHLQDIERAISMADGSNLDLTLAQLPVEAEP